MKRYLVDDLPDGVFVSDDARAAIHLEDLPFLTGIPLGYFAFFQAVIWSARPFKPESLEKREEAGKAALRRAARGL